MIFECKDEAVVEGEEDSANSPASGIRPCLGPVGLETSSCAQIGGSQV